MVITSVSISLRMKTLSYAMRYKPVAKAINVVANRVISPVATLGSRLIGSEYNPGGWRDCAAGLAILTEGGINLWENEAVMETARDLKMHKFKDFDRVEENDVPSEIRTSNNYRGLWKHRKTGLQIIKRESPYPEDFETLQEFCSARSRWGCPIVFTAEKDKYYYELNLIPFGYKTVKDIMGDLTPDMRKSIGLAISAALGEGLQRFFHSHLHSQNILVKTSDDGDLVDIKIIDLKFIGKINLSKYPALVAFMRRRRGNLVGADLKNVTLEGFDFRGIDLSGADLTNGDLPWADLRSAILRNTILFGTSLTGADLRGADLNGANLTQASLIDALYEVDALKLAVLSETYVSLDRAEEFERAGFIVEFPEKEHYCEVTSPSISKQVS